MLPWAVLPEVEYFVIEYEGYAVIPADALDEELKYPGARERYVSRKCFALRNRLSRLQSISRELYNDGRLVVFSSAGISAPR